MALGMSAIGEFVWIVTHVFGLTGWALLAGLLVLGAALPVWAYRYLVRLQQLRGDLCEQTLRLRLLQEELGEFKPLARRARQRRRRKP
jgi:hypothetical protein